MSDQNSTFSTEKDGRIPAIQDETGAYFIDGCPKYFGIILNFLRRGVVEKGANVDLKFLRNEAEYFCIEGMVKVIDKEIGKTEKTSKEEASNSRNQFRNLEKELRVIQGLLRAQGQYEDEIEAIQNDLYNIKDIMQSEISSYLADIKEALSDMAELLRNRM